MTKLYADFISQQQAILRNAGLIEGKNPSKVSVDVLPGEEGRRKDQEQYPAKKEVWRPSSISKVTKTTEVEKVPSSWAGSASKLVGNHTGPKGTGRVHSVVTWDNTGNKKVKYFAGNYNTANKYRPGGKGAQGGHTDLHDSPEEAANSYHGVSNKSDGD